MAAGDSSNSSSSSRVQEAQELAKTNPRKAEAIYKEIVSQAPAATSDAATREYEQALLNLGELYKDEKLVCLSAVGCLGSMNGILTGFIFNM